MENNNLKDILATKLRIHKIRRRQIKSLKKSNIGIYTKAFTNNIFFTACLFLIISSVSMPFFYGDGEDASIAFFLTTIAFSIFITVVCPTHYDLFMENGDVNNAIKDIDREIKEIKCLHRKLK